MAGINFADQLKESTRAGATNAGSPGRFDSGGPSFDFESHDKGRLLILVLGIASIFGAKYYARTHAENIARDKENEIAQYEVTIGTEKQKLASLKDIAAEAETYNKRLDELQQKIGLVESVSNNRNLLVRMIDFTVSEMPGSLWLSKVNVDSGADSKIELTGYAMSLQLVGEFLKRLEGAVFFPSWNLVETESPGAGAAAPDPNRNGKPIGIVPESKRFTLNARVVRP